MIARFLLIMSSTLTLAVGAGCIFAGYYAQSSFDIRAKLSERLNLSTVPQGEVMKKTILDQVSDAGLVQKASLIFVLGGLLVLMFSVLGLWASFTGSTFCLVSYLSVKAIVLTGYLVVAIMMFSTDSLFEKPILYRLLDLQASKFVSVAELYNNSAGDGALVSTVLNVIQQQLQCCGMRTVGDIRSSPRWQASSRALAGVLKLRRGQTAMLNQKGWYAAESRYAVLVPPWLSRHMPSSSINGLFYPIDLPQDLPPGIRIPSRFNITFSIVRDSRAIERVFEDSLVLRTPFTCCKFKGNETSFTFDARTLMANLVDHDCPFQSENTASVHNETCYAKLFDYVGLYSTSLIVFGIFLGLIMGANVVIASQLLIW